MKWNNAVFVYALLKATSAMFHKVMKVSIKTEAFNKTHILAALNCEYFNPWIYYLNL